MYCVVFSQLKGFMKPPHPLPIQPLLPPLPSVNGLGIIFGRSDPWPKLLTWAGDWIGPCRRLARRPPWIGGLGGLRAAPGLGSAAPRRVLGAGARHG